MAGRNDGKEHRYLFHHGKDCRCYDYFGAHPTGEAGGGIVFRVWAPRAEAVFVAGDFNGWKPEKTPLAQVEEDPSVWEAVIPEAAVGDLYKFVIETDDGRRLYKADPFAFETEKGSTQEGVLMASRISDIGWGYAWKDAAWMEARRTKDPVRQPMNIYEVQAGSWRRPEEGVYNYRELADRLIPYVKKMGYTHIELLPVMEYPFEGSWGYQVTGYYSVTSRYGTPTDFKYFIEQAHRAGIGVIMDWVPAHFPKDGHGLIEFDGYPLYEDSDPTRMEHKGWGTRAFDYGRPEVVSFLISSAYFFCDVYHIDGLRVDAVAAMLYLDYDREEGEWHPNERGGRENLEAVRFLQQLNQAVLTDFAGVTMTAEESTAWPLVTSPPAAGGLGFNFKWNMGWMNDALEYFRTDPLFRAGIHNKLTFSLTYAYSENYILPVSHDEVVHGKRSLLDKMPGEYDEKFSGLRTFFLYMMTHPGKKLSFMGAEFGQFAEWDEKKEIDWILLDYDRHREMQAYVKKLNHVYLRHPELWETDADPEGFRWIDADNSADNTYSYYRREKIDGRERIALVVLNLSGRDFPSYDVGVPAAGVYTRTLDTDDPAFGGTGTRTQMRYTARKGGRNWQEKHITLKLPARSGILLTYHEPPAAGRKKR